MVVAATHFPSRLDIDRTKPGAHFGRLAGFPANSYTCSGLAEMLTEIVRDLIILELWVLVLPFTHLVARSP
jgi:hypothetical protein